MDLQYNIPVQPRQVRLELSSACNAKCAVCHRLTMQRTPGHMSFELVKKCIEDIRKFPNVLTEISPSHYGEFLLNPEYKKIMMYISASVPYTRMALATNGSLFNDESVSLLVSLPNLKWVNVSVNAYLPETYKAFTGLEKDNLPRIKDAVMTIKKLRPDITLQVSMVADSSYQSPRERELFIEYWNKLKIQPVIESAQYNNRPNRAPAVPIFLPCRSLFSDLVVLQDGQVISCCFAADPDPDLVVGDALRENLLNIWHSDKFRKIRSLHNAGKRSEIPICSRCTFA